MNAVKKAIWTLDINNYQPEITALTYPLMKRYAQKIGADFNIITKRKFPNNDIEYERLQVHTLGEDYDWNFLFDADTLLHPELFDPTIYLTKDTVLHSGIDRGDLRWRFDQYFLRDGRNIGSCNWFTLASNWCLDLWKPLEDLTEAEIIDRICVTNYERLHGVPAKHLVLDYITSRNVARYGLKVITFKDMLKRLGRETDEYFHHEYTVAKWSKEDRIKEVLNLWKLDLADGSLIGDDPEIKPVVAD
jgi:hypothetical protein